MGDHVGEWEEYKRLERKLLLMWLLYLPVCFAALLISVLIFSKDSAASGVVLAVTGFLWVGICLSLSARLRAWKCPRCHSAFDSWWRGSLTSRCVNCGLQKILLACTEKSGWSRMAPEGDPRLGALALGRFSEARSTVRYFSDNGCVNKT
jgi:hypothetical protein